MNAQIQDWPLVGLDVLLVVLVLIYGLGMLAVSRRDPRRLAQARVPPAAGPAAPAGQDDLFFVFLLPCLNEEKVIQASLQRLLALPAGDFAVLVIDDGSDDDTVAAVSAVPSDRVWLLRRTAPNARQGKGEALNAAIAHLTGSGTLAGRDPDSVIIVVVDADGRLDAHAVAEVTPYFTDPKVGAVQIGVRINNRTVSRLARMQDMEFVIYTEIFQRGRRHLGSVGLGGNGQFMRLSALRSLGPAPWTRSLTEDLDLGVRLLAAGWRNEYCSAVAVHQQGVIQLRRLIRQRSRWFQGHLQSWRLIPTVLRDAPDRARADLLYHLSSPAVLLIASLLSASFLCALVDDATLAVRGTNPLSWWLVSTYALTFGPALAFGSLYWARERQAGLPLGTAAVLAHLYVCYTLMWYVAGWWAVGRTLGRRTSWAKTDRVAEIAAEQPALAARSTALPSAAWPSTGRHRERGRVRAVKLAGVAVLSCAALGTVTLPVRYPNPGPWYSVFDGYGRTSVTGSGSRLVILLAPSRTQSRGQTHAALVLTRSWYQNFTAVTRVRTVRQLRRGAAGRPNPWEVGWVVWHYASNQSFYALTLEPDGWLLSKQDSGYRGSERFLASGHSPRFRVGVTHTVRIVQIGNQITAYADGHRLGKFTDTRQPYLSGRFGVYAEDSLVRFRHIQIKPVVGAQRPSRTQSSGRR